MHVAERRWSESRMRENRMSGSMRGRRRRAETHRACVLLYRRAPRGARGLKPKGSTVDSCYTKSRPARGTLVDRTSLERQSTRGTRRVARVNSTFERQNRCGNNARLRSVNIGGVPSQDHAKRAGLQIAGEFTIIKRSDCG